MFTTNTQTRIGYVNNYDKIAIYKKIRKAAIYDQSSSIRRSCEPKALIIEIKSFRNVYTTNNAREPFQLINRHLSVSIFSNDNL